MAVGEVLFSSTRTRPARYITQRFSYCSPRIASPAAAAYHWSIASINFLPGHGLHNCVLVVFPSPGHRQIHLLTHESVTCYVHCHVIPSPIRCTMYCSRKRFFSLVLLPKCPQTRQASPPAVVCLPSHGFRDDCELACARRTFFSLSPFRCLPLCIYSDINWNGSFLITNCLLYSVVRPIRCQSHTLTVFPPRLLTLQCRYVVTPSCAVTLVFVLESAKEGSPIPSGIS